VRQRDALGLRRHDQVELDPGQPLGQCPGASLDQLGIAQDIQDGDANPRGHLEQRQFPAQSGNLNGMRGATGEHDQPPGMALPN
jgi:hypothetical protein